MNNITIAAPTARTTGRRSIPAITARAPRRNDLTPRSLPVTRTISESRHGTVRHTRTLVRRKEGAKGPDRRPPAEPSGHDGREEGDSRRAEAPRRERDPEGDTAVLGVGLREHRRPRRPIEASTEAEGRTGEQERAEGRGDAERENASGGEDEATRRQEVLADPIDDRPGGKLHERIGDPDDRYGDPGGRVAQRELGFDPGEQCRDDKAHLEGKQPAGCDRQQDPPAALATERALGAPQVRSQPRERIRRGHTILLTGDYDSRS